MKEREQRPSGGGRGNWRAGTKGTRSHRINMGWQCEHGGIYLGLGTGSQVHLRGPNYPLRGGGAGSRAQSEPRRHCGQNGFLRGLVNGVWTGLFSGLPGLGQPGEAIHGFLLLPLTLRCWVDG